MRLLRWLLPILPLVAWGTPVSAAEIAGFTVNAIEGLGEMEGVYLDRFKDDFQVSYSDCLLYLEGVDPSVIVEEEVDGAELFVADEEPFVDIGGTEDVFTEEALPSKGDDPFNTDYYPLATNPRFYLRFSVDSAFYAGFDYAVKVGTACMESGYDALDNENDETCRTVAGRQELTKFSNIEVIVELVDLIGEECVFGDTGTADVYVYVQDPNKELEPSISKIEFQWDYDPPEPPTDIELLAGESNIRVDWNDEVNNEVVEYKVYWSTTPFDSDTRDQAQAKGGLTATSYQITGLEIGATYYVGVVAADVDFENESELSEVLSETPILVSDFWEYYRDSGGGEQGGFCFVATAAFGTPMEPAVMVLRHFRDQVLLRSAWGRRLVDLYYLHGPALANTIRDSEALRLTARTLLVPAVALAWLSVEAPPVVRLGLLLLVSALLVLHVRRKRFTVVPRRLS